MTNPIVIAAIFFACAEVVAGQARQLAFPGEWRPEGEPYGLHALRIADSSGHTFIDAWGICQPQPCHWGKRPLTMLGTGPAARTFLRGFATWDHGFATTHGIVRMDGERLVAEFYTLIKGNRGRPNYFRIVRFLKAKGTGHG